MYQMCHNSHYTTNGQPEAPVSASKWARQEEQCSPAMGGHCVPPRSSTKMPDDHECKKKEEGGGK